MVECKITNYELNVFQNRYTNLFYYVIDDVYPSGRRVRIRDVDDFTDEDTALEWGRRALWCLSLGE